MVLIRGVKHSGSVSLLRKEIDEETLNFIKNLKENGYLVSYENLTYVNINSEKEYSDFLLKELEKMYS